MPKTQRDQTRRPPGKTVRWGLLFACLLIVTGPAPCATASLRRGSQMYREQLKKEAAAQEKFAKEQAQIQQEMIEKAAEEKRARDAKRQENLRRNREAAEKRINEKAAALRKRLDEQKLKSAAAATTTAQSAPLQLGSSQTPSTSGGIRAAVSAAINSGSESTRLLDCTATVGAAMAASTGG